MDLHPTGVVMSTTLFGLREFGDAGAFLAGATIPMVPLPEFNPPAGASIYWCRDHMIMSEAGREDALRADACDGKDFDVASLDMEEPDVARWCDRQIATSLGLPNPEHAVLSDGNEWCFWLLGNECPRFIGDLRAGLASVVRDIPCTDANIPTARAALLRALFGVSNA
jgi:hypothetical protein